jgi:hypothetical protein
MVVAWLRNQMRSPQKQERGERGGGGGGGGGGGFGEEIKKP